MTDRPTHRVSVKIALFNQSGDRVLMTVLPAGGYGLPGGHVEGVEQPDDAICRELREELGLGEGVYRDMRQYKFWREQDGGRIILGYVGTLDDTVPIRIDTEEVADIRWVTREDLINGVVTSETYNDYLLDLYKTIAKS